MESKYQDRDLSWLDFNNRVLNMYKPEDLKTTRYIGIASSNLDEFISVRVGRLIKTMNKELVDKDEYNRLFKKVNKKIKHMNLSIYHSYTQAVNALEKNGYELLEANDDTYRDDIKELFKSIYPSLTPFAYDYTSDFSKVHSYRLTFVIKRSDKLLFIPIDKVERVYALPNHPNKLILVEDVIKTCIDRFVNVSRKIECGVMRVIRNAEVSPEHIHETYFVEKMKKMLEMREDSSAVYLEIDSSLSTNILSELRRIFNVSKKFVHCTGERVDYSFMQKLPIAELKITPMSGELNSPFMKAYLSGKMFEYIKENKSVIFEHPYDSFDNVISFLYAAAEDPNVTDIRQTLYRVSSLDSLVIDALCLASRNGKRVCVYIEIQARFDEAQNIKLLDKLKENRCIVIHGLQNQKAHAKFALIARKEDKHHRLYAHVGTGNYNEVTSKFYHDLSYITSDKNTTYELLNVFNSLASANHELKQAYPSKKVLVSPHQLLESLCRLIENEIINHKKGKPAYIFIKVNSIDNRKIINMLYSAAEAGVPITIQCRGICAMKPIVSNLNIVSTVGDLLEHDRLYYFENGGNPKYYLGSSDLLDRNLLSRVEILVPVQGKKSIQFIQNLISDYTMGTHVMDPQGKYMSTAELGIINPQILREERRMT